MYGQSQPFGPSQPSSNRKRKLDPEYLGLSVDLERHETVTSLMLKEAANGNETTYVDENMM